MTLPHHRRPPFILFARLRCWISGHLFRPHDLYSDKCIACGKTRRLAVRRGGP